MDNQDVDDEILFKFRINRIYDIFLPEENYVNAENLLLKIIKKAFNTKKIRLTPNELLNKVGEMIDKRCILSVAAKNNIPIFVPDLRFRICLKFNKVFSKGRI